MRVRRTLAAISLAFAGCGYSAGTLAPHGHTRVYVPVFVNKTYYRDLEVKLTDLVAREAGTRPGISIAPKDQADIVLMGTIVGFEQHVLSEAKGDQVRESSTLTHVRVELRDPATGQVRRAFELQDRAEFVPAIGETLTSATNESFTDLARRIVDGLEEDFPHASAEARGTAQRGEP